jgi:hypothetical protein
MATIGTGVTYLDLASRLDPNNKVAATIVELLAQTNQVLEDMVTIEGNLPTGHKTTVRTGLPTATWRLLNYGVQPSKSTTTQVTDECGMLEAYAEVDKDLVKLNGNTAAFRLSEDRAFLEKMNQEMASALFYGNRNVTPEKFNGLAPRFAAGYTDRWSNRDKIGSNIVPVVAGASGNDQTSIWLVVWGENTVHATYPKGSALGIQHQDLGEVTLEDSGSGKYQGYRTHYKWDMGLVVRDWRYIVRVCNIDLGTITADPTTGHLFDALDDAITLIPNLGMGRATFYCNPRVEALLRKQLRRNVSGTLTMDQLTENRSVVRFNGIPFKRSDGILNTESPVTFS